MHKNQNDFLKEYIPAQLYTGKTWYIGYYALHPETKKLKRVRIKINRIRDIKQRKKYAEQLINKINRKLANGWNPFVEKSDKYEKVFYCIDKFLRESEIKLRSRIIRKSTFVNYKSHLENFKLYLAKNYSDSIRLNEISRKTLHEFLDYKFLDNKVSAVTRDNYLSSLKVFYSYLKDKQYIDDNYVLPIKKYGKSKSGTKIRKRISHHDLKIINNYLNEHDKHFLFACKLMYYTFIRSNEMAALQLEHINIEKKQIYIPANISKNKKDGFVTIPDQLMKIMLNLEIYNYPSHYYLFSDKFKPGLNKKTDKKFRDKWLSVRRKLKLPENYHFYSFKDTGITHMIPRIGLIATRDQARHHSVEITNRYAVKEYETANNDIVTMSLDF